MAMTYVNGRWKVCIQNVRLRKDNNDDDDDNNNNNQLFFILGDLGKIMGKSN